MHRNNVKIYDKNDKGADVEMDIASTFDVYRWDSRINKWVPGGLHHTGTKWEPFNLKTYFSNITSTDLYAKYSDNENVMNPTWVGRTISQPEDVNNFVIPAFRDMFRAGVEEYCDKDDLIYHQAFIRLVSGTDNRAKNTYFQIVGKLYTTEATVDGNPVELVKVAEGDYKKKKGYVDGDNFIEIKIENGEVIKTGLTIPVADIKKLEDYFWKPTETGDYKIRLM